MSEGAPKAERIPTATEQIWAKNAPTQVTVVPLTAADYAAAEEAISRAWRSSGHGRFRWAAGRVLEVVAIAAASVSAASLGSVLSLRFEPATVILVGIVVVVVLGSAGLVLRGLGEMPFAKTSRFNFKAWGYFLGAMAYVVTASVALSNTAGFIHLGK